MSGYQLLSPAPWSPAVSATLTWGNQLEKLEAARSAYLWLHLVTFEPFLPFLALLSLTKPYWALLGLTGPYWALLGLTGPY